MKADYEYKDILFALNEVGVQQGDDVFVHSNLGFFGLLRGCKNAEELAKAFLQAFIKTVGEEGTVVIPTYSYSFCHGELYDPYKTGTTCGMLSEYMIRHYPEYRSWDPNFSIAVQGKHREEYLTCNIHEAFGRDCFWERFLENKGKVLCLNVDAGSTFIHYIERRNNVPYRFNKAFNGIYRRNEKIYRDYAVHFCYESEANAPCIGRINELAERAGIIGQTVLGRGTILVFEAESYYDYFNGLLKVRPRVLCVEEDSRDEGSGI